MKLLMEKLLRFPLPLIHGFPLKLLSFASLYFFTNRNPPKTQLKIADIAVHFLLSNLKRLILHHARLVLEAENQVEMLENDIRLFKAFLKDSAKKRLKNDAVEEFVREILVVVCEGEYIIGAFENLAGERRDRDLWKKLGFGGMIKLVGIAKEVESVRNKVKRVYSAVGRIHLGVLQIRRLPEETKTKVHSVRQENLVVEEIEVVSVISMPRVGLMALGQKVPHDLRIGYGLPLCEYGVIVSRGIRSDQEYLVQKQCARIQKGEFMIALNQDMGTLFGWDEVLQVSFPKSKRETTINMVITTSHGENLCKCLSSSVCLIVMDDVWYSDALDQLKMSAPDINNGSRILATSRMKNMGFHYGYC